METRNNYDKLQKHISEKGIFYALWRGLKYVLFLIRRQPLTKINRASKIIKNGRLGILTTDSGIQLLWSDRLITAGAGLNLAMNILGMWTDSAKGKWELVEKNVDSLKLRVVFRELALSQIWDIKLCGDDSITWKVSLENKEWIHINELRFVTLTSSLYTTWFCGYEQGIFSRFDEHWHDFTPSRNLVNITGARFPRDEAELASFGMGIGNKNYRAIIQNTPQQENAHLVGFRIEFPAAKGDFQPGMHYIADIRITVFRKDAILDEKIEALRQEEIKSLQLKTNYLSAKEDLTILLANLPWQRNGAWGVRAGSRWPHIKDPSECSYQPFPFFLAQAAALLENNGINTEIIDALAERITEEDFLAMALLKNPDYLVAETSVPSFKQDMAILHKISTAGIKIIICGPNTLIYEPGFMRQYPFIEFVLKGEYEFTLLELLKTLRSNGDLSKVAGILYRSSKEVLQTEERQVCPIDSLPWPHRTSLPMDKYCDRPGDIPYPSAQMLASRGCPFKCSFCLWPQVMYSGNTYRGRDIDDVVNEMEYLVKQMGFKSIYFDDDSFNIGKERMLKFCQKLKEKNLAHIPWAIMARADMMDEEILQAMRECGLSAVKYGIESASAEMIAGCQKQLNLTKTESIIGVTKKLGIKVHLTFIFGFPGETKESMQRTIAYGLSLDPDSIQFSILTPFPGTRLFEQLEKEGKLLTYDWSKYDGHSCCVFKTEGIEPEELLKAKDLAYAAWGDHLRKKRGLKGDLQRFNDHLSEYGVWPTLVKTTRYLDFIIKRSKSTHAKT